MPVKLYQLPAEIAAVAIVHAKRAILHQPVVVDRKTYLERQAKCEKNTCGYFEASTKRCLSCRCWMSTPVVGKWNLAGVSCPEGLW